MTEHEDIQALRRELVELRHDQRRARGGQRLLVALALLVVAIEVSSHARSAFGAGETTVSLADSVLRVRGIVVTDARGIERVVIGAPLPDPMYLGKRGRRQGPISGILMFDAMGTERNGYGTSDDSDEMIFTMDNIAGQSALFIANPGTGTHLSTWDTKGNYARMGVYERPMLYIDRDGKRTFTAPDSVGGRP